MGRRDLKLNWWLKQRPRPMLCCSKVDGGILIGSLLQVNRYLHIGRPISTAPCVASPFAGRGAASAASIETAKKRKSKSEFRCGFLFEEPGGFKGGSPVSSSPSTVVRPCPETRVFVKNQAESADGGGGCVSALNGPKTPDPTKAQPSHHGGEEKQQTHGGLLGTKLKD